MTVEELIEKLSKENPEAIVYTTDRIDDIAVKLRRYTEISLKGRKKP